MHETAICKKIQTDVLALVQQKDIKSIHLDVGELGPLLPGELKRHLMLLTGWNVLVNVVLAEVACSCGYVGKPTILERGHDYCLYLCPTCARVPKLLRGSDIVIKEVKV